MEEILGVSVGGENRDEGVGDIGFVRGRGDRVSVGSYWVFQWEGNTGLRVGDLVCVSGR